MDSWKVIGLISLAILASGCTSSSSVQGIAVNELSVEPQSITAGQSLSVSLEAVNAGLLEGTIDVGKASTGDEVLTNYCPDYFSIEEFRASSSRSGTGEKQSNYKIGEGEKARFFWRLKQDSPGEIPLQGYDCNMRFEIPFNYSVRAYKQLQVKKNRGVEGSTNLATDISPGPLSIDMKILGSTASQQNTILERDNASLYLTAYNQDTESSTYQGLININDIEISSGGSIDLNEDCGEIESVTLVSGNKEIYRCNIKHDSLNSPSIRGEVETNINYTFVKDVGQRQVKVKYGGR